MDQIDINNIKKNTIHMIAIDLYGKDVKMKKRKNIKIGVIALLCLLSLTGLKTVDALTNGEISKRISVFFTGEDNQRIELKGDVYTDENGDIWIKYKSDNSEINVNESELEKNDMEIESQQSEFETEITIQ